MPDPYAPTARLRERLPALPDGDPKNLSTWRDLLDALALEQVAVVNRLAWSGDFSVDPGGTHSAFVINIGAFYGLTLHDLAGETFLPYFSAGAAIGASKIEGGGNLANNGWYSVYAWSNAGVLDYEISLAGPSASRVRKTGSTNATLARVYLGSFPTGTTGAPVPLQAVRGRYLYRRSAIASVDGAFAADGLAAVPFALGAVARTPMDLSARVPPHARRALLHGRADVTSSAGTAQTTLALYDMADTTSPSVEIAAAVAATGDTARVGAPAALQLTSAQVCGYAVIGTGDLHGAGVDLTGWEE